MTWPILSSFGFLLVPYARQHAMLLAPRPLEHPFNLSLLYLQVRLGIVLHTPDISIPPRVSSTEVDDNAPDRYQ